MFFRLGVWRLLTTEKFEVEGTFETGILAASWNPDESVVAIVTGMFFLLKS